MQVELTHRREMVQVVEQVGLVVQQVVIMVVLVVLEVLHIHLGYLLLVRK
jgi:hypothetical protein